MSHFKLEEVLAHKQLQRLGCGEKTKTPEIQPYILSPLDSLQAFQKNMQGSELLGTLYWNPYGSKGGNCEYIPKNASELTIRHQQMLSRFEGVNTRGTINLTQCGAAIPREKIAINRGTVKHTPVIGIGKATHNGGYNSPREPGSQEKCYTIDQAGEQFQEFHNTGARFFYPQKDSLDLLDGETYLQFQEDLYEAMEGKKRPPETEITNSFPVIWTSKSTGISIPGIIDLDGLEKSYAREFKDALELANCTMLIEEPGKKANFRFFMAGMGAFSGGIAENKSHPTAPGACCLARLQAINKVVAQFLQIFLQTGENKLKGIGTLGLPYSRNIAQQYESEAYALLESIQKNLVQMNIKWSGAHEFSGKHSQMKYWLKPMQVISMPLREMKAG